MTNELLDTFISAQRAARTLSLLEENTVNRILSSVADDINANTEFILDENRKDLSRMDVKNPKYDRLKLTQERIDNMVADLRNVACLPSPLNIVSNVTTRPNGLKIKKISVPFGVVGIIYEARPNVSLDVFSICFKSGNVCMLKGGSDADNSNRAIVQTIRKSLANCNIDPNVINLLPASHEAANCLLKAIGYVDVIIPRGSANLIRFVRENAKVPVIETGAGICHTYFDEFGDTEKGTNIVFNAKTRRVSVCNALDCLIIHKKRLCNLPSICNKLSEKNVRIYADSEAFSALKGNYPQQLLEKATPENFGIEYLDYKMSIKTVDNMQQVFDHIRQYSSKHSEAIISENKERIDMFMKNIDAACVYANASTAFTDGAQFGLGAEIGISTQKMHARGPMSLRELTSYKWIIEGDGQIRT